MKRFKKIYIEITNVCNLQCKFCPQTTRKQKFMDEVTFVKILDKVKIYTDFVFFHVKGEPLMHPQLGRFLDLAHERNLSVNLTTNGTLIDKVQDQLLNKPALRQINFSVHSLSENDKTFNNKQYLSNILTFIRTSQASSKTIFSLRFWNLVEKHQNVENNILLEMIEKEFAVEELIETLKLTKSLKLSQGVYLNQEHKFTWPDLNNSVHEVGFCYGLRDQIAILVDGTVVPCCLDNEGIINLGNINSQELIEILESKRACEVYNGFSNRHATEELCQKCGYKSRFDLN